MDSFSCILYVRKLYKSLDMHYFMTFMLKDLKVRTVEFASSQVPPPTATPTHLVLVSYTENPVWYARKCLLLGELRHEKTCLCHVRTTKEQISLRIRAV